MLYVRAGSRRRFFSSINPYIRAGGDGFIRFNQQPWIISYEHCRAHASRIGLNNGFSGAGDNNNRIHGILVLMCMVIIALEMEVSAQQRAVRYDDAWQIAVLK